MLLFSFIISSIYIFLVKGDCPKMVSRKDWRSEYPLYTEILNTPVPKVFFHHTATGECKSRETCSHFMRSTQEYAIFESEVGDIPYNFVIGGDGNIYVGRGWDRVGAHTYGHNRDAISIAFVGNYARKDPTPQMLSAAENLIECGVNEGYINPNYGLYGHRDGTCTMGPGKHFYNTLKNKWPHWHALGELKKKCR